MELPVGVEGIGFGSGDVAYLARDGGNGFVKLAAVDIFIAQDAEVMVVPRLVRLVGQQLHEECPLGNVGQERRVDGEVHDLACFLLASLAGICGQRHRLRLPQYFFALHVAVILGIAAPRQIVVPGNEADLAVGFAQIEVLLVEARHAVEVDDICSASA